MKTKFYFLIIISMITFNIKAQEQIVLFENGYLFRNNTFDTLQIFDKKSKNFEKRIILTRLKGTIKKRDGDTLFIKFWNISNDVGIEYNKKMKNGQIKYIDRTDNGKNYIYILKGEETSKSHFDIPYRFSQLMATNIPFRVLLKSGTLESDFLNANATFVWVRGTSRIFKSEFVEQRNRYLAYGPFLGLSSIDNPVTDKKEFGLNYGVNLMGGIQGLNIVVALGFQNGFKQETKNIQPYLGFGIGFKLFETFSPEIKNKE
ncbi:hypothetical protein [Chryseobacterium gambrini]|uniref:hypothetical protein n=1 Tax=Chryseobacterium gambrini TaxID=373672 RepID=UPI0022F3ED88|nr:hypothetical protein [Chryseobacterium gambrini]WBX96048.1 hypothetical protein PE065_14395 [Chryseobacterium gambrini]